MDLDSQLTGFPGRRPCRASRRNNTDSRWSFRSTHRQPNAGRIAAGWGNRKPTASYPPTFPRKFADVDWFSRKIIPNKICAECWPGAAFGPHWLLTERLRYETIPLQPALRDRVHVHGRRDDAHGSHRRSHPASGSRRAAGASRRHEQRHRQG